MLMPSAFQEHTPAMSRNELPTLKQIARKTRYPVQAFDFVRKALDYTVHAMYLDPASLARDEKHVTGRQLCVGIKRFAVDQYGHMARTVLHRWHVNRTEDLGQIVFAMVNAGVMHASESDTVGDFDAVFSFDELDRTVCLRRVPVEGFAPAAAPKE